jgi:proteasome lid subunit RPN8/RPN11
VVAIAEPLVLAEPAACDTARGIVVPPELWSAMVAHARAAAPEECCAIGIGPAGTVAEFHALANVHEQPVTRYEIDARDQLRLHLRAEVERWETTLVFHSHPATEPVPSITDTTLAGWPDAVYAILSLADPEAPLLRAWSIVDGASRELAVELPA